MRTPNLIVGLCIHFRRGLDYKPLRVIVTVATTVRRCSVPVKSLSDQLTSYILGGLS
jgi:hypothetical protein